MSGYRGFTILEVLVVIGVLAVLASLSTWGVFVFQRASQLEGAASELISNLRTIENSARNSVPVRITPNPPSILSDRVDGYLMTFANGNYGLSLCYIQGANYNCSLMISSQMKSVAYRDVTVSLLPADASRCNRILYERKTGQIYTMPAAIGAPQKGANCTVNVTHNYADPITGRRTDKQIVIDLTSNTYVLL